MKILGLIAVIIVIGVACFGAYLLYRRQDTILSPVPEERGVRVIFVTPTP